MPDLFAKSNVFGTFKGFIEKGFEFSAEIVAPYESSMLERPQLGQFLLIELGSKEEASLGRITKFVPSGLLASPEGEDYINTMQYRELEVPEDLKKQKLKYKVQIKLLGAVKKINSNGEEKVIFVPSQRRLPHLGAKVALPSDSVLRELCQLSGGETDLGDYGLGEFVYSGKPSKPESILRHVSPKLQVTFNINNLVSKRTVVFARAGYGKSNLIKYLVSELYRKGTPKTDKGKNVGVLIFDADGEYFWPDFKDRPGLCDVPHLQKNIIVFTNRQEPSEYYGRWKAGDVKIDIRNLPARDVIGISISSDRQNQQNVLKLKSLDSSRWCELVDLISKEGLQAEETAIGKLIGYQNPTDSKAEILAAKSNMYYVVNHLHDPQSKLIYKTIEALREGYCVVVDISLLSSTAGYNIAGLLLRKIFNYNQEHFTGISPIPVIAIIEEAQSVLGRYLEETSPFVEWVKEGRKYDLGAILVTQQPGSLAPELLSQADNWFCFHLLSEGDASTLGKYNAHYSHDILAHLIGEPIPGNCYMWSAPKQPFVLPVRIRSFEELYAKNVKRKDQTTRFENSAVDTIQQNLEKRNLTLAKKLQTLLKEKKHILVKHEFEDGFLGIFDKQLYKIFEEMLSLDEFSNEIRTINELMAPILKKILDYQVIIREAEHKDKGKISLYCAPKKNWDILFN